MLSENEFKNLFDKAQSQHADKLQFTQAETENFRKAFDDPEFRRMFAEYMDEMQDPKNREENEAYIRQLEGEQKVPEGKELIRPKAGFVAKTHKTVEGKKTEKLFINIVSAEAIDPPIRTKTKEGESWSLPYSLGPPHMERDKNDQNAPCFDCCFHPDALKQTEINKRFVDSLVVTAIEGVEEAYKRQNQSTILSRDFHVLKGVNYKSGVIATMMVDSASKSKSWRDAKAAADTDAAAMGASGPKKQSSTGGEKATVAISQTRSAGRVGSTPDSSTNTSQPEAVKKTPLIKKGFLNTAKSTIYPESVSAKDKTNKSPVGDILIPGANATGGVTEEGSGVTVGSGRNTAKGAVNPLVQEIKPGEVQVTNQSSTVKQLEPSVRKSTGTSGHLEMTERSTSRSKKTIDESDGISKPLSGPGAGSGPEKTPSSEETKGRPESQATADAYSDAASSPDAVKMPKYSLVERGSVSLGDFEALRGKKVTANRPAELVCKIEVPLVTKASQIVLDVSEKILKLTYQDIYELTVKLPYPVFDKKGTAKYDKTAKTLTVVLPVQPPTATDVSVVAAVESASNELDTSDSGNEKNDANDNNSGAKSPGQLVDDRKRSSGTSSDTHSRWVRKEELEEERRRSEELAKAIKDQAEAESLRVRQAQAVTGTSPVVSTDSNMKAGTGTPVHKSAGNTEARHEEFMPCTKFSGRRIGYVFKLGNRGLGYYADVASSKSNNGNNPMTNHPALVPGHDVKGTASSDGIKNADRDVASHSNIDPPTSSLSPSIFPFEYRQTKPAVAILVQVPHILTDSVRISFKAASVEISFEASTDPSASASATTAANGLQATNSKRTVFSMKLHISGGFLDVPRCKYDVAAKNMVLVLAKRIEGLWPDTADKPLIRGELLPSVHVPETAAKQKADSTPDSECIGNRDVPQLIEPSDLQPRESGIAGNKTVATARSIDPLALSDQLENMKFSTPAAAVLDLD